MFEKMNGGLTIKMAFDVASPRYPRIAGNVVFVGDTNLKATMEKSVNPNLERITKILDIFFKYLILNKLPSIP